MSGFKRENRAQRKAFEAYYRMSPRSYKKLGSILKMPSTTIAYWSKKFKWQERIDKRLAMEMKKTDNLVTDRKAEMNARHIAESIKAQKKSFVGMMELPFNTAKSATAAYVKQVDVERLARGEATAKKVVESEGTITLDKLKQALAEVNKEYAAIKKKEPVVEIKEIIPPSE